MNTKPSKIIHYITLAAIMVSIFILMHEIWIYWHDKALPAQVDILGSFDQWRMIHEALRNGSFNFWNPYMLWGMPDVLWYRLNFSIITPVFLFFGDLNTIGYLHYTSIGWSLFVLSLFASARLVRLSSPLALTGVWFLILSASASCFREAIMTWDVYFNFYIFFPIAFAYLLRAIDDLAANTARKFNLFLFSSFYSLALIGCKLELIIHSLGLLLIYFCFMTFELIKQKRSFRAWSIPLLAAFLFPLIANGWQFLLLRQAMALSTRSAIKVSFEQLFNTNIWEWLFSATFSMPVIQLLIVSFVLYFFFRWLMRSRADLDLFEACLILMSIFGVAYLLLRFFTNDIGLITSEIPLFDELQLTFSQGGILTAVAILLFLMAKRSIPWKNFLVFLISYSMGLFVTQKFIFSYFGIVPSGYYLSLFFIVVGTYSYISRGKYLVPFCLALFCLFSIIFKIMLLEVFGIVWLATRDIGIVAIITFFIFLEGLKFSVIRLSTLESLKKILVNNTVKKSFSFGLVMLLLGIIVSHYIGFYHSHHQGTDSLLHNEYKRILSESRKLKGATTSRMRRVQPKIDRLEMNRLFGIPNGLAIYSTEIPKTMFLLVNSASSKVHIWHPEMSQYFQKHLKETGKFKPVDYGGMVTIMTQYSDLLVHDLLALKSGGTDRAFLSQKFIYQQSVQATRGMLQEQLLKLGNLESYVILHDKLQENTGIEETTLSELSKLEPEWPETFFESFEEDISMNTKGISTYSESGKSMFIHMVEPVAAHSGQAGLKVSCIGNGQCMVRLTIDNPAEYDGRLMKVSLWAKNSRNSPNSMVDFDVQENDTNNKNKMIFISGLNMSDEWIKSEFNVKLSKSISKLFVTINCGNCDGQDFFLDDLRIDVMKPPRDLSSLQDNDVMKPPQDLSFLQDDPDEVIIQSSAKRVSLLTLMDLWAPGWEAFVDGAQTKIYRSDIGMRSVVVPAGIHKVTFRYWPPGLTIWLVVGLFACIIMVVVLVRIHSSVNIT